MGAPNVRWGGFSNGRIPRSSLVDIGGGKLLQADAARAFARFAAAFRARWGDRLYLAADQDAYRDVARQQYMLDHPEKYPHAHAAVGTSIHGWARSVDVSGYGAAGSARHVWMQQHGPDFGFSWSYGRELGESWHWDYLGPVTTTAGDGVAPFPTMTTQEVDMLVLKTAQHGIYTVGPGMVVCHGDDYTVKAIEATGAPVPVWEIGPDDLPRFVLEFSGARADQIPPPGYAWLAAYAAAVPVDAAAVAERIVPAVVPQLVAALGEDLATGSELAAVKSDLLAAIGQVDEATLATFGLKRA